MKLNRIFFSIFICFLTCSCSKDFYFKRDQYKLSKELDEIAAIDQGVRKYSILVEQRFGIRTPSSVWDSLQHAGAKMNAVNVSKLPPVSYQIKKLPPEVQSHYLDASKTGDKILRFTDDYHRDVLYKIIKKYGYPSYDTRPWENDSIKKGVGFVLTHFEYESEKGKDFLNLMIKEYKRGRANKSDMQYLIWHVQGRMGPKDPNVDQWIKDYKKGKTKREVYPMFMNSNK